MADNENKIDHSDDYRDQIAYLEYQIFKLKEEYCPDELTEEDYKNSELYATVSDFSYSPSEYVERFAYCKSDAAKKVYANFVEQFYK